MNGWTEWRHPWGGKIKHRQSPWISTGTHGGRASVRGDKIAPSSRPLGFQVREPVGECFWTARDIL